MISFCTPDGRIPNYMDPIYLDLYEYSTESSDTEEYPFQRIVFLNYYANTDIGEIEIFASSGAMLTHVDQIDESATCPGPFIDREFIKNIHSPKEVLTDLVEILRKRTNDRFITMHEYKELAIESPCPFWIIGCYTPKDAERNNRVFPVYTDYVKGIDEMVMGE